MSRGAQPCSAPGPAVGTEEKGRQGTAAWCRATVAANASLRVPRGNGRWPPEAGEAEERVQWCGRPLPAGRNGTSAPAGGRTNGRIKDRDMPAQHGGLPGPAAPQRRVTAGERGLSALIRRVISHERAAACRARHCSRSSGPALLLRSCRHSGWAGEAAEPRSASSVPAFHLSTGKPLRVPPPASTAGCLPSPRPTALRGPETSSHSARHARCTASARDVLRGGGPAGAEHPGSCSPSSLPWRRRARGIGAGGTTAPGGGGKAGAEPGEERGQLRC